MKNFFLSFALCFLLNFHQAHTEESFSHTQDAANSKNTEQVSRVKRAMDMRRLSRGIHMLRLGKRGGGGLGGLTDHAVSLDDLLDAIEEGYYDEGGYLDSQDSVYHGRYRRSADPSKETVPSDTVFADDVKDGAKDVKRSVDSLLEPDENQLMEKRPMNMLRLGKRPMNMLRLGKRPMGTLQEGLVDEASLFEPVEEGDMSLDKRPMNMLRLGKRQFGKIRLGMSDIGMFRMGKREDGEEAEGLNGEEAGLFYPVEGGDPGLEKRPMNMLRLGKRQIPMLRLGKRQIPMLRLGRSGSDADQEGLAQGGDLFEPMEGGDLSADKRPMNMLRLGKRPMNMLRLGKRPMNMLRLGKRPMNMLRLGKRPMNMLRLGKRPMNMLRLGKRPMNMLRLGKRPMNMLRLGKREANDAE